MYFDGVTHEEKLDNWWKTFRFIHKELAIRAIDARRNEIHGMRELQDNHKSWNYSILPILYNRKLWEKANVHVKYSVYRAIIDAIDILKSNKYAKVELIENL